MFCETKYIYCGHINNVTEFLGHHFYFLDFEHFGGKFLENLCWNIYQP